MKRSQVFTKTSKTVPSEEVSRNAQLLIQAGFIHKRMAGVYEYLPWGRQVLDNIVSVIRREMNAIGAQELSLTSLQPKDLWEKTGRWDSQKIDVWFKTQLSTGGEAGLAPTHEEPLTDIMTKFVNSYSDLPIYAYQIQTKFRNELRAKSGLMRTREFLMKDLYDFSRSKAEHEDFYQKARAAYIKIFDQMELGDITYPTFASGGIFSQFSEEFQMISPVGEDKIYVHHTEKLAINHEVWNKETMKILGTKMTDFREEKAIELGNIFHLETKYSEALGLKYSDQNDQIQPVYMGCYGIGPSRLMGAIAEHFSDKKGLVWPAIIAPAKVYLINIEDDEDVVKFTTEVYQRLLREGVEVIWDDRAVRAGKKFADADLLGIPFRAVVSQKLGQKIEIKPRTSEQIKLINIDEILKYLG
jgi:prolyl-tRNA synthetase